MDLDRIAPSRRQACATRRTGRQTWRKLLFVHWEVPADVLRPLVPPGLSLDAFEGRCFVGLVPFAMHDVRFGPVALPDFLETNLRTYVHAGGVPGVWFFSLDAQSAPAVWGGRAIYGLPYFRADMTCRGDDSRREYGLWRRGLPEASLDVQWTVVEERAHVAVPGTLEHFLTERYALYGRTRRRGLYRVRVHHAPWPLQGARLDRWSTTVARAAGLLVGVPLDQALASEQGVSVETFAPEPLEA